MDLQLSLWFYIFKSYHMSPKVHVHSTVECSWTWRGTRRAGRGTRCWEARSLPMVTGISGAELEGDPHVLAAPPSASACLAHSPRPLETHKGLEMSHAKGPGSKRGGRRLKRRCEVLGASGSSLGSDPAAQCPHGLAAEGRRLCCPSSRGFPTTAWPKLLAKGILGGSMTWPLKGNEQKCKVLLFGLPWLQIISNFL